MRLDELLKDEPETLNAVNNAINKHNEGIEDKTQHVRFVDLSEGGFVAKDKFTNLETKYNDISKKYTDLQNDFNNNNTKLTQANNNITELQNKYDKDINEVKKSAKNKMIDAAINSSIEQLNIEDDIIRRGVLNSIDRDKIEIDDNYNISGLSEQIQSLRDSHSSLFGSNSVRVNTRSTQSNVQSKKVYKSLEEIARLSPEEFRKDKDNILKQITALSKK